MGTVTQRNLAHVQAQLGGSNPISLSEYYRGGAYVPSLRSFIVYEPSGGGFTYVGSPTTGWFNSYYTDKSGTYYSGSAIYWGGALISSFSGESTTTVTVGSYTYYRGTDLGSGAFQIRRTSTGTTSINTGVPSSGAISLNQLLGAENP